MAIFTTHICFIAVSISKAAMLFVSDPGIFIYHSNTPFIPSDFLGWLRTIFEKLQETVSAEDK